MSETARTGFLIRGTKEKSEVDVFHGHHFLASYCGNNSGTIWE
jgi:hypothetical protein